MTDFRIKSVVGLLCLVFCTQAAANPESMLPEGDPVKMEVNAAFQYSHFAEDWVWRYYDHGAPVVNTGSFFFDTLGFMAGGQYYFNSRFANPSVPFAFIPYDYRSNSVGLFAGYGTEKWKDVGGPGLEPEHVTKVAVIGLGGRYHTSRHFFGGSFLFQREIDPGSDRLLQLSAAVGWLTPELKFGIRSIVDKEFQGRPFFPSNADQVYVTGQPFFEYTPGSFVRVSAAISRTYAVTFGDYWEMELPVSLSYTIPDRWWEFGVAFAYFNNENDVKRYTFDANTRRFIGDGSIYALGGITHGDFLPVFLVDGGTVFRLGLGGDYVYNRIMQLTLQYNYEFGDPVFGNDGRRGHTLAVMLRLFD